jgi:hypothetical protein
MAVIGARARVLVTSPQRHCLAAECSCFFVQLTASAPEKGVWYRRGMHARETASARAYTAVACFHRFPIISLVLSVIEACGGCGGHSVEPSNTDSCRRCRAGPTYKSVSELSSPLVRSLTRSQSMSILPPPCTHPSLNRPTDRPTNHSTIQVRSPFDGSLADILALNWPPMSRCRHSLRADSATRPRGGSSSCCC